jgi:hypothetical protein
VGDVREWEPCTDADIDGLVRPLGLSGRYTVRHGLEDVDAYFEFKPDDNGRREFVIMMTPNMTALHVVRAVAAAYVRTNPERNLHIYFESLRVDDDGITMGMGS